jgi:hypothetical protein
MTEKELAPARAANERCRRAEKHLEDLRVQWRLQKDARGNDVFEAAFKAAIEEYHVAYIARAQLQGPLRPSRRRPGRLTASEATRSD